LTSPLSIARAAARNELVRNTEASINDSTVKVSNGNVKLEATKNTRLRAKAETFSLTASLPLPNTFSLTLDGTYSSNTIFGNVNAFIAGSTVETTGTGDVLVDARDTSAIDATSGISARADLGELSLDVGRDRGINRRFHRVQFHWL